MSDTMMEFTPTKFKQLKKAYAKAVKEKKDQFDFHGRPLVTNYAKYLIEYLEPKLGKAVR